MSPLRQLTLENAAALAGRASPRRWMPRGAALADLSGWLPVLALFALFLQLALLGLRPALAERERLARESQRIGLRESELARHAKQLDSELGALHDPIFAERVLRARRSAAFATPPRPLELALSGDA